MIAREFVKTKILKDSRFSGNGLSLGVLCVKRNQTAVATAMDGGSADCVWNSYLPTLRLKF
jgi:hypothetical protein